MDYRLLCESNPHRRESMTGLAAGRNVVVNVGVLLGRC